jgi:hypothetical protein
VLVVFVMKVSFMKIRYVNVSFSRSVELYRRSAEPQVIIEAFRGFIKEGFAGAALIIVRVADFSRLLLIPSFANTLQFQVSPLA